MDVSVILPGRNVAPFLAEQLAALAEQDFQGSWEVVYIDDDSTDGSLDVARSWTDRFPQLRVLSVDEHRNVAHARNLAIQHATGRLLLFCDADDIASPGWMSALVDGLAHSELVAGSSEVTRLNPTWARDALALPQQTALQRWDVAGWDLLHAGGGNIGLTRALYDRIGPLDESEELSFGEAADYFFRAQLAGVEPRFVPEAVMHVRMRTSYRSAYRQARGWAEASVALHRKFAPHGMPRPRWIRGLLSWALVPLRLLRVRSARELMNWVHLLGWRVGRVRGSVRCRMLAF